MKSKILSVLVFTLSGCAITPMSEGGRSVNLITANQAQNCQLLDTLTVYNSHTLISDPEQDAKNKAKNKVFSLNGNALLIKDTGNYTPSRMPCM